MKKIIYLLSLVFILASTQSHAARFGKGRSFGQHSSSQKSNNHSNPQRPQQQQNQQHQQQATPPPPPQKPSLMSRMFPMLAGLTAGALLGSLLSGSGLGGAMGSILIGLLGAAVVFFIVRKLMAPKRTENRFNEFQYSAQPTQPSYPNQTGNTYQEPVNYAPQQEPVTNYSNPTPINNNALSFYQEEFLRTAKTTFIRMQNAYDTKNLADIRNFTTPEVFAEIQMQIHERGDNENYTEVVSINSSLLEMNDSNSNGLVQFTGKIREERNATPVEINEVWSFVKHENTWLISGVHQEAK